MEISIKWNICRICLLEERVDHPSMKSIFTETRLVKQIVECAGIELASNDGLPEKICRKCLLTLKYAVSFRNTCRKSDEHLRSVIQKAKEATIIEHAENTLGVEDMEDIIEELDDGGDEYVYVIEKVDDRQGVDSTAAAAAGDGTEIEEPQETENSRENDLTTEIKRFIKKEKYNLIDLTRPEEQQGTRNSDNSYSVEIMPADPLTSICVEDDDDDDSKFYAEAKNKKKTKQISIKNYEENESKENLDGFFSENEVYTVHETGEVVEKSQTDDSDLSYIKVRIRKGSDDEYILGEDESEEIESAESDEGEKVVKKEDGVIVKRAKYSLTDFSEETNRDTYGVCFYCGNTFASDQSLKIHIRNVHKVRTLECELCYKRFSSTSNLTAHMRIHTGERRYECKYCHRRFTDRSTHIKHERIHTNEKPFKCEVCQKAFSLSTSLKAHVRIHTGEKPFECQVCNKAFKLPHQLKAHLSTMLHKQAVMEGKEKKK